MDSTDESCRELIDFAPADPHFRELLARLAYERDRQGRAGESSPATGLARSFFLRWEGLSADQKRPYRCAIEVAMDAVLEVFEELQLDAR